MIRGLKICGVSDPKTLNYILNHRHKPSMIVFITNYEKSRRFIEYDKLQSLINIDKKIILIGVGGIDSPESAWERICSGASLIQLYTGWIYKGPQLVPNILEGILKQLNKHQLSNIKEAIGSDLKWVK